MYSGGGTFLRINVTKKSPNETNYKIGTIDDLLKLYKFPNITLDKISELDLSNCQLVEITCELKNLSLKRLKLQRNQIQNVPRCLYLGLDLLEFLDISHNKISNFDIEPNCCKTLKVLNLSYNNFRDIPQWIMNHRASNLRELHYDFNKVTSLRCIFGDISNFWVAKLSLRNCFLRDEDSRFLKNCRYLEYLDIGNIIESIRNSNLLKRVEKLLYQPNWKNLCVLKMNNLSLAVFPEGLFWLEGLVELHLTHNCLVWLPKDGLQYFVNLEVLNLSHNFLSGLPDTLTWLVDLKVLLLCCNHLEISCDFSQMKNLEILDLYSNRLENFNSRFFAANLIGLDVEMNLFDTRELSVLSYQEKKNQLRMRILEDKREDGFMNLSLLSNQRHSEDSSSDVTDEEFDRKSSMNESENFDDELFLPHIPMKNYEKPEIYNDEVIFCDAD